jgi:hypothetical protein
LATAGATVTLVEVDAEPPEPVQVSLYVAVATSAPVDAEPLTALPPDHDPDAVQAVALVLLHFKVLAAPVVTEGGDAESDTVGAGVRLDRAADTPGARAPKPTANSANTTSTLLCATTTP